MFYIAVSFMKKKLKIGTIMHLIVSLEGKMVTLQVLSKTIVIFCLVL